MSKIIGIDLGTTNSCVSILEASVPKVIENAEGARTTPSVVAYADDDQVLVGISAKRQAVANPKNTLYAIKRLIGRRFGDAEVKKEAELAPYSIVEAKNGDAWVEVGDKKISPPEVSALVLRKLRSAAEDYLGESVSEAVITVPAYFNDSQRQATKDAGKIAGLDVKRIINEPTAAAMAFGIDKKGKDRKVAVYDLGGGTFDVSIIEIVSVDGDTQFEVLATNGDTFLGGEDFDQLVIDYLISEFKQSNGIDLSSDVLALQRLKEAAEKAKIELSSNTQTDINLPYVTADSSGPKHMNIKLTRAKLESLVDHLIDRTFEPCKTALKDAKITGKVDDVILVGGMTRMPYVQQKAQEIFGIEPRHDINPDEAVASGAAIQAAVLQGDVKDVLLLDVTPLSLGIETEGSVMTKLIEKNTTIPTKASKMFSTAADNQSAVTVHVLQGEREQAQYNKSLGMFNLSDILPARRGEPQIEVAFDIDANGILHVTATDRRTGKDAKIQVTASSGLSEDEINRMVKDAEEHAEEDRKFADLTKLRNLAEAHCNAIRKQVSEHGKDLSEQENANIQDAISAVEQAAKGDDTEAINAAITKLGEASTPLHEKAQASASSEENANPEGSDAAGSKDSSSDESDAEVEVVRKDDNEKKSS